MQKAALSLNPEAELKFLVPGDSKKGIPTGNILAASSPWSLVSFLQKIPA